MGIWDDFRNERLAATQTSREQEKEVVNTVAANQNKIIKDYYGQQIADTESDYNDDLRTNEIQRIVEEQQAFKYKNPNYERKTTSNWKPTPTKTLREQFFN